jgi:hypothetical protein
MLIKNTPHKAIYDRLQMTFFFASAPHIPNMYAAVWCLKKGRFRSVLAPSGVCFATFAYNHVNG